MLWTIFMCDVECDEGQVSGPWSPNISVRFGWGFSQDRGTIRAIPQLFNMAPLLLSEREVLYTVPPYSALPLKNSCTEAALALPTTSSIASQEAKDRACRVPKHASSARTCCDPKHGTAVVREWTSCRSRLSIFCGRTRNGLDCALDSLATIRINSCAICGRGVYWEAWS